MAAQPIWQRKADMLYLFFFTIHIPIILLVDITPLYPDFIKPSFLYRIREFYINEYKDQFFSATVPLWFTVYAVMEAVYHLPLSFWAIDAIIRDDPMVPLNLVVWATQTAVTTATCLAEMLSWTALTQEEKGRLAWLYGPYLALAVIMGVDMFGRLRKQLLEAGVTTKKTA